MSTIFLALILACQEKETETSGTSIEESDTQNNEETEDSDNTTAENDTSESDTEESEPCPENMMLINDSFCIDQYEAHLQENINGQWQDSSPYQTIGSREVRAVVSAGITPQAHISGEQAEVACQASGKRLCSSEEWLWACQGASGHTYPYGENYQSGACNDYYDGHPLIDYYGTSEGIWDSAHMNDPNINQQSNTVAQGGVFSECISEDGVYDMHGNLHEWVSEEGGTFRGGFYADGAINGNGCFYQTTAHNFSYFDYSTGFRCCSEAN